MHSSFDVAQKDQRRPATSRVSWYFLQDAPSATAHGAMDRRMDGQTESLAAVAAAVLIPFSLCQRYSLLPKPLE